MFEKSYLSKIIIHVQNLNFVESIDEDEVYFYDFEKDSTKCEQIDLLEIITDERNSIMDDEKEKKLEKLFKEDEDLPNFKVKFERTDAFPDGCASYMISIYQ